MLSILGFLIRTVTDNSDSGTGQKSDEEPDSGEVTDDGSGTAGGRDPETLDVADAQAIGSDDPGRTQTSAGKARRARQAEEPDVSVTIEGKYDTVFERLEHPQSLEHDELDAIAGNIESTLLAVVTTRGGIRSEIYQAVDFEMEDPWEIRLYLEVLEMHGLVRLQDDRWVPADAQEPPERRDGSE
jgi:hypothetical protein